MEAKVTKTQLEKYYECKNKVPDAIWLFRVGDFYEMYERDAVDASELLGVPITSKKTTYKSVFFCIAGFPRTALDIYLPKIIRSGRRVAISE